MHGINLRTLIYLLITLLFWNCSNDSDTLKEQSVLFKKIDPSNSGLDFINNVSDKELFNILTYRNFYNGGGVAIGDINNDGLSDIFFTSNLEKNKLYLNKGNFVFEDISKHADVEGKRSWSTGVVMVDINSDGWLDIYVCNSGDIQGDDRENELFINNHDLTFTEQGEKYNLNNKGLSTHAAFFDYDVDGDLDCYILNNSFIAPNKIELFKNVRTEVDELGGDKLYRNDGGIFHDVTTESGIFSSKIGFGLGVSIGDLNDDLLPDIYISNDFWERDYLYINLGNGKFREQLNELISVCSVSSMGADIADINNDGFPEIFTTDMLAADNYRLKAMTIFDNYTLEALKYRASYHYQILQNCLHLNKGNLNFQEISAMSGVSATDWSWGSLIFDFQNDGLKDIFVSNGIARDIMYIDFTDFISDRDNVKKIVIEKGKFDWRDFIPYIPSNPIKNYGFVNKGNLNFSNQTDSLGLGTPSFSNGSAYGDLDNDGDMDLVVNNENMQAFLYQNESEKLNKNGFLKFKFLGDSLNRFGIGASIKLYTKDGIKVLENYNSRGFQSSIEPSVNFGLGDKLAIDSAIIFWSPTKKQVLTNLKANQVITVDVRDATPNKPNKPIIQRTLFTNSTTSVLPSNAVHKENIFNDFNQEPLLVRMVSTEGPKIVKGDVNGDNLEDFILLGGPGDYDKLFIQNINGTFYNKICPHLVRDSSYESTCGALFDLNKDGKLDLIVGSGGNESQKESKYYSLRIYLGDGTGNFHTINSNKLPQLYGDFSCIVKNDFDKDGFDDLFIGGRVIPGSYGQTPKSYLLRNNKGELFPIESIVNDLGMITGAVWSDVDKDGDDDLVVVGDWMPVTICKNENGDFNSKVIIPNSSGWWNSIEANDIDQDGDDDYVLGNWGRNIRFKAHQGKPLTMYVKDFDNNDKSEFIINWYPPLDNISYPFATKMEITQQIPLLKKRILKHEVYSHHTYESLFTPQEKSGAKYFQTEILESSILWNDGELKLEPLPMEAQITPVFTSTIYDFDGDGLMDIWLGGNFYGLKPQVGRCNSSNGILLKSFGKRNFKAVDSNVSGLAIQGEVKDSKIIRTSTLELLLLARNNESVQAFSINKTKIHK